MKNGTLLTLSCLLTVLAAPAPSVCEEFLLYAPKPAAGDQVPTSPDQGVLVKKVKVKRGDTLSRLSQKHIGTASWFPQVLLFNSIKNPDLIYVGDTLLIPVKPGHEGVAKKKRKHTAGVLAKGTKTRKGKRRRMVVPPPPASQPPAQPVKTEAHPARSSEQDSYQRATQAYLSGDYQKALNLYGQFLQKFPRSRLAADASLNQANCLMRLSGE